MVLLDFFNNFDTGATELELKGSVAIVGNSPNIISKSLGSLIDSYDNVVRFNHAKVENLQNDVGSKTTHIVINCHLYNGYDLKSAGFESFNHNFWEYHSDYKPAILYVNTNPVVKGSRGVVPQDFPFYVMPTHYFNSIGPGLNLKSIPTIGLAFIASLISKEITPSLFGFSIDNSSNGHYFEKRPEPSISHSHSSEHEILKLWSGDGLIDLFV